MPLKCIIDPMEAIKIMRNSTSCVSGNQPEKPAVNIALYYLEEIGINAVLNITSGIAKFYKDTVCRNNTINNYNVPCMFSQEEIHGCSSEITANYHNDTNGKGVFTFSDTIRNDTSNSIAKFMQSYCNFTSTLTSIPNTTSILALNDTSTFDFDTTFASNLDDITAVPNDGSENILKLIGWIGGIIATIVTIVGGYYGYKYIDKRELERKIKEKLEGCEKLELLNKLEKLKVKLLQHELVLSEKDLCKNIKEFVNGVLNEKDDCPQKEIIKAFIDIKKEVLRHGMKSKEFDKIMLEGNKDEESGKVLLLNEIVVLQDENTQDNVKILGCSEEC